MREIRTTIMGRRWRIVFAEELAARYGNLGDCDGPRTVRKSIYVDADQDDWELLDTLVHEMLHAGFPDTKEESVAQFARDVRRVLGRVFTIRRIGGTASETESTQGTQSEDTLARAGEGGDGTEGRPEQTVD